MLKQYVCHLNVYNHVINYVNEIHIPNMTIFVGKMYQNPTTNMTIMLQNQN